MTDDIITFAKRGAPPSTRLVPRTGMAVNRRDLTEPAEIIERMARDILAARREGIQSVIVDLTEHGWSIAQVMRWGSQAHVAAHDPRIATQDAVERFVAGDRDGDPVAAIDAAAIVAAGEAAVAQALAAPITGDMSTMIDDLGGDAA